jgi:hypothetical protein
VVCRQVPAPSRRELFAGIPYNQEFDMRYYWLAGYSDVSRWWGHWAKWPVRALPEVLEVAG